MSTGIVWFRRDLRLADNPAWSDALFRHDRVVPAFVIDPGLWDVCAPRRVALLAGHLRALDEELRTRGGRLFVERGRPAEVLDRLRDRVGAAEVVVNGDVTPYAARRDGEIADRMPLVVHQGLYVHAPGSIRTNQGTIYRVFSPFFRAWSETEWDRWPEPGDATISPDPGEGIPALGDPPLPPGEMKARQRLARFAERVDRYRQERDRPDLDSTSHLSIDLKYGTLSPRQVVAEVGTGNAGREAFVRQVAWRDFHAHLMWEQPDIVNRALRPEYRSIEWNDDPEGFAAWKEGRTGYPIVDAGMRQLREQGWVHNRVRLLCASFLTKSLLIDWRLGERWYRRQLLDGDVAQNVGNWQWVAGTGADAAPYFRVFNPVSQSRRFDPDGEYIRRWVPELAPLQPPAVHAPWELDPGELEAAGVVLDRDYPSPIVDHGEARQRALARYRAALDSGPDQSTG